MFNVFGCKKISAEKKKKKILINTSRKRSLSRFLPSDTMQTQLRPIARKPPMFKNFSDGEVAAIMDKPPTIPAV